MPLQPGQQIGRFKIVRLIAQGGMAEVYRAEQELAAGINRPAALKLIRPEYTESPDFREMFLDEARTACTLSHPNIVHIYEVGEADGQLYMAMELVPGETLATVARSLRDNGERFTDEALLAVGIHTCSALEAVHALKLPGEGHVNLVHRDVSPHNLLLSSSGSLKLIDFGIAKALTNKNLTSPGVTKGKAGYFSPEQAMGRALDGRSDLFSLGVTLYKLAFGSTPFDEHKTHQARNNALVHGRWARLSEVCPGLPPALYAIVDKALQLKPEDRFKDARTMRAALEHAALEVGVHVGPSSLSGYVDEGGEISATPSQRIKAMFVGQLSPNTPPSAMSALASAKSSKLMALSDTMMPQKTPSRPSAAMASPASDKPTVNAKRHRTERLMEALGPSRSKAIRNALFGVSAISGVAIVLLAILLFRRTEEPRPTPRPAVATAPGAKPAPAPVPSSDVHVEVAQPTKVAPVHVASLEPHRPRVAHPVEKKEEPAAVVAKAEEKIPAGKGGLRIGVVGGEGHVWVGNDDWGGTPLNKAKIPSGQYVMTFASSDGKKKGTCQAVVMPDRVTRVIYNFDSATCRTE